MSTRAAFGALTSRKKAHLMSDLYTASIKEKLWHEMRDDLARFVPEVSQNKLLMCCACGRFLTQDFFDLEHLIPQQALKRDPAVGPCPFSAEWTGAGRPLRGARRRSATAAPRERMVSIRLSTSVSHSAYCAFASAGFSEAGNVSLASQR